MSKVGTKMTKKEKLLARFLSNPPPTDFKWHELVTLLNRFGYRELTGSGGSHNKFYNPETGHIIQVIPRPHGGSSDLRPGYIRRLRKDLEEKGVIK